jgi:hypothetical protein
MNAGEVSVRIHESDEENRNAPPSPVVADARRPRAYYSSRATPGGMERAIEKRRERRARLGESIVPSRGCRRRWCADDVCRASDAFSLNSDPLNPRSFATKLRTFFRGEDRQQLLLYIFFFELSAVFPSFLPSFPLPAISIFIIQAFSHLSGNFRFEATLNALSSVHVYPDYC